MCSNLKLWGVTDIQENVCEEVNFHSCTLADSDLDAIVEALAENTMLRKLMLNSNHQLTGEGVAKMIRALPSDSAVEEIFLWDCNLDDSDVNSIEKALRSNKTVKGLWLDDRPKLRGTGREKEVASGSEKDAAVCVEEADLVGAQQHYELALSTKIDELGPDHEYVANTHIRLANVLEKQDLLDPALVNYKAGFLIYTNRLDAQDIRIVDAYDSIARIVVSQCDCSCIIENPEHKGCKLNPALERFASSLQIKLGVLLASDVRIAESHYWIGGALQKQGRLEDALSKYEDALKVYNCNEKTSLGKAKVFFDRGTVFMALANWASATESYRNAAELFVKHLGPGDMCVADSYAGLARALHNSGEFEEAIKQYESCMKIQFSHIGAENAMRSEAVAGLYQDISACYRDSGELLKAVEKMRAAATCYSNLYGATHQKTEALHTNADELYHQSVKASMFK